MELPDSFSKELKNLLEGLLVRDVDKRLGCRGRGAEEIKEHPFFAGIDWHQVYIQKYTPPLIPPRGEVNAADAFDIGSFDEEDTKGIKLTEADQELYRYFPLTISERYSHLHILFFSNFSSFKTNSTQFPIEYFSVAVACVCVCS